MKQSLHLAIRPSITFAVIILFVHLGAICAILIVTLAILLKIILLALCISSFVYMMRRYIFFQHRKSIVKCWVDGYGQWYLQNYLGKIYQAELRSDSLVMSFLLILNFKVLLFRIPLPVLLFKNSLDSDTFRRLQVYLF